MLGSAALAFLEGRRDKSAPLRERAKKSAVRERLAREAEAETWIQEVRKRKP
jgi:hypothetical protein